MPDNVQVRVSQNGDIYCKPDPHPMIHHTERMIRWHSNQIEFEIKFLNGSPFVTGEEILVSTNKWTVEKEVKQPDEGGMDAYVYEVREQNSTRQATDPGLIVRR